MADIPTEASLPDQVVSVCSSVGPRGWHQYDDCERTGATAETGGVCIIAAWRYHSGLGVAGARDQMARRVPLQRDREVWR